MMSLRADAGVARVKKSVKHGSAIDATKRVASRQSTSATHWALIAGLAQDYGPPVCAIYLLPPSCRYCMVNNAHARLTGMTGSIDDDLQVCICEISLLSMLICDRISVHAFVRELLGRALMRKECLRWLNII